MKFKPVLWMVGGIASLILTCFALILFRVPDSSSQPIIGKIKIPKSIIKQPSLGKVEISQMLGQQRFSANHLKLDYLPAELSGKSYKLHLTLDPEMQEKIESIYERYSPSYAAFVAIDPETGKILAMVDYSAEGHQGNLNLRASFPAASVFKVVTSAAALDEGKVRAKSVFPVNGSYGTLYKRNLKDVVNRWTRFISIEEAFAKSVNTVFAKIAMNRVGPDALQKYADGFGFNQNLDFDMPIEMGSARVPEDEFGLAESGSGYTKRQTLNPIQGAMIAASVVNGGAIPRPFIVDQVITDKDVSVYSAKTSVYSRPMDRETAKALALIMENTITRGTAHKEYRDYNHNPILSKLFIGAKTGSLSGDNPGGKYDWFVGFAQSSANPKNKIAFASMIVNRKYWKVKAAHVAREAIIKHFSKTKEL